MEGESSDQSVKPDLNSPENSSAVRTSSVYRVNPNLPKRFNHPECFRGYSKKTVHPLYQSTNQTYGSKKPTVHEMPTTFHGSRRTFSEHILKSGMYRDNGFNTSLEKSQITGPSTITTLQNRISFHHSYRSAGNEQTETNMA